MISMAIPFFVRNGKNQKKQKMNKFKAALFDLDGTLVETEGQYTEFWSAMGRKYRPDVPDLAQIIKGTTLVQIFDNFFPDQQWREEITAGLDEWEKNMEYPFIPGALEFLKDLKAHGVKCAVVTSSNKKKIDAVRAKIPDFDSLFDRILTSEDFRASKPDPDCYNLGAKVFNCKKKECIVFEDAFTGLQAGMSSRIFTVGITTYNSREQIQDKCNYVIDNFLDMTFEKAEALLNPETPKTEKKTKQAKTSKTEAKAETKKKAEQKNEQPAEQKVEQKVEQKIEQKVEQKTSVPCPPLVINNIVDLINAPQRQLILTDQQIQHLPLEEAEKRYRWFERTLAIVLNYDVVISDTNIWLDLLTGHTSSHSDPRFNARLQFERQLEFISKLTKHRHGRFMMMAETYEEIDRFASLMEPVSHKDADFSDESICRNIAARLAKRLILSQQRENRLRIEGIGAESHHSAFADPAIIRRCVELFSQGKKVLLLTNDASVAIRAMGMCDDLQRTNGIDDETWDEVYAELRPMVMTMDDLKVLDVFTRQFHFLQMAAGKQWMEDVPQKMKKHDVEPLTLWTEGFRRRNNNQQKPERNEQKHNTVKQQPEQKKEQKQQPEQKKEQNNQKQEPAQKNESVLKKEQKQKQEGKQKKTQKSVASEKGAVAEKSMFSEKGSDSSTETVVEHEPVTTVSLSPESTPMVVEQKKEETVQKKKKTVRKKPVRKNSKTASHKNTETGQNTLAAEKDNTPATEADKSNTPAPAANTQSE